MKISWFQFFAYLASFAISLVLNQQYPDVLRVLCNPLPLGNFRESDSSPTIDRTLSNQRSLDQEK